MSFVHNILIMWLREEILLIQHEYFNHFQDNMFSMTDYKQDLSCWPDITKNSHRFCMNVPFGYPGNCYFNNPGHEFPNAGAGGIPTSTHLEVFT